jgi:hypothetical protein
MFLVLGLDLGVLLLDFGFGDEVLLNLGHCEQWSVIIRIV